MLNFKKFQAFAAARLKITAFWNLALWLITLMMEAVCTSETSVYFYETNCAISKKAVIFTVILILDITLNRLKMQPRESVFSMVSQFT
jgi:hypothetical protein